MDSHDDRLDRLAEMARGGDEQAYRAFLATAAPRLRAYVARRLVSHEDQEDAVQECLIALHNKFATLDPKRPVGPWLFAIARYKLADHWRKAGRQLPQTNEPVDIEVPAHELWERDLEILLGRLPQGQSEAIRLTRLTGMTGPEASRRLGIGLSALKLRVHRGMAALRSMVREER